LKRTIQVRISHGEHQFVAECLDLPVVTQAPTLDELAINIREAIGLHLDGEDLAELGFCPDPTISRRWNSTPLLMSKPRVLSASEVLQIPRVWISALRPARQSHQASPIVAGESQTLTVPTTARWIEARCARSIARRAGSFRSPTCAPGSSRNRC